MSCRSATGRCRRLLDDGNRLRGYGLTHETRFLAPWYQGITAFHIELPILKRLTGPGCRGALGR